MSLYSLAKSIFRNGIVAPIVDVRNYFHENFGNHGWNEPIYQHLFLRLCGEVGIQDEFEPVGGAASYSLLYLLFKCTRAFKPNRVIELGAGQSTLLLEALRKQGVWNGSVFTLEEDKAWAEAVSARTASRVAHAPLCLQAVNGRKVWTYGLSNHEEAQKEFDFLLIDGPRGSPRWSRLAATQFLDSLSKDRFIVIMDDFNRFGEQQTMRLIELTLRRTHGAFSAMTIRSNKHQRLLAKGVDLAKLFH
jgi:hypothetical protein